MITRRSFIGGMAAGIVGAFAMDPERLLWVPGAKKIFIPESAGKVEIYDMDDMNAILKINQYTFGLVYTNPEDVLRDSRRTGQDPFYLYRNSKWISKDII